jgi:hypothetical protein
MRAGGRGDADGFSAATAVLNRRARDVADEALAELVSPGPGPAAPLYFSLSSETEFFEKFGERLPAGKQDRPRRRRAR